MTRNRKYAALTVLAAFALAGCRDGGAVHTEITDGPLPTVTQPVQHETIPLPAATATVEAVPAPLVTRHPRPVQTPPKVTAPAPLVTRHPRPVRTPPVITTPVVSPEDTVAVEPPPTMTPPQPTASASPTFVPAPHITRHPRPVNPDPTITGTCPEEDPESCTPQPTG
jgi:hypothetical protein